MTSNTCFTWTATAGLDRQRVRWTPIVRYVALAVVACVSAGCTDDVAMQNPQTGKTEICRESLRGFNPWSQSMACVANHEAEGWTKASSE
jgi:hypothetical protein